MRKPQWSLGAKLAMLGAPFLLLVVISTTAMLWMSWQLDGGAAAVNEAGRMRMQAYRMALLDYVDVVSLDAQPRSYGRFHAIFVP